jgi:hypothetical protein
MYENNELHGAGVLDKPRVPQLLMKFTEAEG